MKSHFKFTTKQRNGIFLLLVIIVALQCVYAFVDFPSEEVIVNEEALQLYQAEVDSLKLVAIAHRKPKIYPFNPNFISDYKGYTLGMSTLEIDRLLKFRQNDKWINSAKQFKQVTKISDSLFLKISPYFKFPKWVTQPKPKKKFVKTFSSQPKTALEKIDLNTATASQLQKVYGIGETFANRILKYRGQHDGFVSMVELNEIYGLTPETIQELKTHFVLKTPKLITKIKLNAATLNGLVTIQYIDYEIAHNIIEERTLREGFKSLKELEKVKDFPVKKIEIIELYLQLN